MLLSASLVLLLTVTALVVAGRHPPAWPRPAPAAQGRPPLAFDLPRDELRAAPRRAFAHYIPTFPVSLDDRPPDDDYYRTQYLRRGGEQGVHEAYGGYLRDRPLGRPPRGGDWQVRDLADEVRQAAAAGLDGFTLDLLQLGDTGGRLWDTSRALLRAAEQTDPGFRIVLMPDMSGLRTTDPGTLATWVGELARSPSVYRLGDGRLVVSPFLAEARPPDWWRTFLDLMAGRGMPVALLPVFLDASAHLEQFAPVSWGASDWGGRSPARYDPVSGPDPAVAARAHALGLVWMQPVSLQDQRPRDAVYDEAGATETLRDTWDTAVRADAELVQVVTWNDYAESTAVAPSVQHGWTFLDLCSWYLVRWKTGREPAVLRDTVLLVHRTQRVRARLAHPQPSRMRLRPGSSPPRDEVEAVALLTAPARVRLRSGGAQAACRAGRGLSVCTGPLRPGTVEVAVVRDVRTTASVVSPYRVRERPSREDLEYVGVTSGRPLPERTPVTP